MCFSKVPYYVLSFLVLVIAFGCQAEDTTVIENERKYFDELESFFNENDSVLARECRCGWSDFNFSSEEDCLENFRYDLGGVNGLRTCVDDIVYDLQHLEVDMNSLLGCMQDTTTGLNSCVESIPETCSEKNIEDLRECQDEQWERYNACHVVYASEIWEEQLNVQLEERCF